MEKVPPQPEQFSPAIVAITIRSEMGLGEKPDPVMVAQREHRYARYCSSLPSGQVLHDARLLPHDTSGPMSILSALKVNLRAVR